MKLSEGGKLYLNEYYILDEALNDVNDFLNEILDRVYKTLEMKIKAVNQKPSPGISIRINQEGDTLSLEYSQIRKSKSSEKPKYRSYIRI